MPNVSQRPTVFSRRLKEARIGTGLSQRALGVRAGLDPSVASTRINRYERGIHVPDPATTVKLAEVLSVPVAYFYAQGDRMARMIKAFDALDTAEQEKILKVARG